jgi:hypothetical protein
LRYSFAVFMRLAMAAHFSRFLGLIGVSFALLLAAIAACGTCGAKAAHDAMPALMSAASDLASAPDTASPAEAPAPAPLHHCCSPLHRPGGLSMRTDAQPEGRAILPPSGPIWSLAVSTAREHRPAGGGLAHHRAPYWAVFASTRRMLS